MPKRLAPALAFVWNAPPLLFTLTTLFWAGNMLVGKALAGQIPPATLAQMRWTLAFVLLLPFAARHIRADWPVVRRHIAMLALLGILGISAYNALVYKGLQTTTVVNAALLAAIFPMVIALVGFVLYRDRLSLAQAGGIVCASAGAATILANGDITVFTAFRFVPGDLWVIGAQLAYASYTVMLRERPNLHPLTFLCVTVFFGQLSLIPFSMADWLADLPVRFDATVAVAAVYLAVFPALLSFMFFNRAVKLVGSNRAAPYFNLVPFFSVLGAMAILGEQLTVYDAAGWVIIVSGIWLAQRKPAARRSRPAVHPRAR